MDTYNIVFKNKGIVDGPAIQEDKVVYAMKTLEQMGIFYALYSTRQDRWLTPHSTNLYKHWVHHHLL